MSLFPPEMLAQLIQLKADGDYAEAYELIYLQASIFGALRKLMQVRGHFQTSYGLTLVLSIIFDLERL